MAEQSWQLVEPGVLALVGTQFRIVYSVHDHGDFVLYQGDRRRYRCSALVSAKDLAIILQAELEQMGVG